MTESLSLEYNLTELPSSQHRAGLAGLVLMAQWHERNPDKKGVCEITHLSETGATLEIDQEGLQSLFDKVYAASKEEVGREARNRESPHFNDACFVGTRITFKLRRRKI